MHLKFAQRSGQILLRVTGEPGWSHLVPRCSAAIAGPQSTCAQGQRGFCGAAADRRVTLTTERRGLGRSWKGRRAQRKMGLGSPYLPRVAANPSCSCRHPTSPHCPPLCLVNPPFPAHHSPAHLYSLGLPAGCVNTHTCQPANASPRKPQVPLTHSCLGRRSSCSHNFYEAWKPTPRALPV